MKAVCEALGVSRSNLPLASRLPSASLLGGWDVRLSQTMSL